MDDWLKAESRTPRRVRVWEMSRNSRKWKPCQEDLIGKDEPLIHHAEGEDGRWFHSS